MRGKVKKLVLVLIILLIIALAVLAVVYYMHGIYYKTYKIVKSTDRKESNASCYQSYNKKLLKYSKDGITVYDDSLKAVYNSSYDMSNPKVDICGKYIVVADIGGKTAYVYDGKKDGKVINTDYEIQLARVSANGVVALLLSEKSSNIINMYNPYSESEKLLVQIPTNVSNGYPVDVDISPNAENVAVCYMVMNSGKIGSNITFYDFSDVGKNNNYLVGVKDYSDRMVADVEYINKNYLYAFDDKGITIFKDMKSPKKDREYRTKKTIKSVVYSDKYCGVITRDKGESSSVNVKVYSYKGKVMLDKKMHIDYEDVYITKDKLVFVTGRKVQVYKLNGTLQFKEVFDDKLFNFLPGKSGTNYFLVNEKKIQNIKLKMISKALI
ncbi:MAG: DUF5711 family protein [Lachnospiraceae bacterium]|nr:DUF5711 family protein [Lachnospiraceae bacterium]